MATIHFLNVRNGDCSIIQHNSGNVTVIDVCNAKKENIIEEVTTALIASNEKGLSGNFNQKKYPVNPVSYLKERSISTVFRFILSHPDMDHLDGIKVFFENFRPLNFWDTNNNEKKEFKEGSPYDKDDWQYYKKIRDGKPETSPRRLTLFSGSTGKYFNRGEDNSAGDGLHILAPTPEMIKKANESGDYHDCSYVILYKTGNYQIIFGGDAHDGTWEHILDKHSDVKNIDLLIAPHHGRKSDRSYNFLDTLNPKITFFGNARSEHLAYSAWQYRDLPYITNNQAGSMIASIASNSFNLYVKHKAFAEKCNPYTFYDETLKAYYLLQVG